MPAKSSMSCVYDLFTSPKKKLPTESKKLMRLKTLTRCNNSATSISSNTTSSTAPLDPSNFIFRSVSFSTGKPQTCPVMSRKEYTQEELEACFYMKQEYEEIVDSITKQVRKMEKGERLKDNKYCSRGLERHTNSGKLEHQQSINTCVRAVLRAQESNHEQHESLGRISRRVSAKSVAIARCRGNQDFDYVQKKILKEKSNSGVSSS